MQYDSDVLTYERVNKNNKKGTKVNIINKTFIIKLILYVISSFFISRVIIINSMAPFGIAFIVVILNLKDESKFNSISSLSALLGYISLHNVLKDFEMYVIAILIVTAILCVLRKVQLKKKLAFTFAMVFFEFCLFKFFALNLDISSAILLSAIQAVVIISIYYILNYSMICFENVNLKHLFSDEEVICMSVMISIIISGTKGVDFFNLSVRNILSMFFIIVLSYVSGSAIGGASGIALGAIIGMNTDNILIYTGILGACGLIVGVFKELGKWISGISYLIIISILVLYCENHADFKFIEAIVACSMFFVVPNKIYSKLMTEFNWSKKQEAMSENYCEKIKDAFTNRFNNFSKVLFTMSDILNNLSDNDKLALKTKSCGLIENLADRVCSSCNMKCICWKRETYYTYAAFEELIQNFQDNTSKVPEEIERKCIKRSAIIKNTEAIVNDYVMNEMWRMQLSKGREVMSLQINNMGTSINEILSEFNNEIKFDNEIEKKITKVLCKNNIEFADLTCLKNDKDRITIKLSMNACGGRQMCVKDVLPIINKSVEKIMCVGDDGCTISPDNNLCNVSFEEAPKFYVASHISRECKYGEKQNGDSYSFGKIREGNYMVVISDGMGYGPQAEKESKSVIDLIEKFTAAGLNKLTAINAVNSIMSLKFTEDEKFSTVDLCNIDLYSGDIEFLKVGGVKSFIKRKNKIQTINSKTLPIGVLDKADVEVTNKKVQNGDIIVMISDGVIDCSHDRAGESDWLVNILSKNDGTKPKELAEDILKKALELCGGKAKDDMTVIVNKVYNLY